MNRIGGKVTHKETGRGIPDLLVVIYDVDPNTRPEEAIDAVARSAAGVAPLSSASAPVGDRLCSLATDSNGVFSWEYEDAEFRIRNGSEKRPDLLLTVVAPEETGQTTESRTLHVSLAVRQNAGRLETFLIRLTSEQLIRAGVPLPTLQPEDAESPSSLLKRIADNERREFELAGGVTAIASQRMDRVRTALAPFETSFKPQLRATLSQLPSTPIEPRRIVLPGESVVDKSLTAISHDIVTTVNDPQRRAPIRTRINLTDAQVAQLRQALDGEGSIDEADMQHVIGASPTTAPSLLLRENPWRQICRNLSGQQNECARLVLDDDGQPPEEPTTPEPEPEDASGAIPMLTAADVRRHLTHLMSTMTSPEEQVVNGLTPRATHAGVEQQIQGLSFATSPADAPAYHDFYNLQLAFEHVWQEAIDEGILDLAEDAYQTIVELGGNPDPQSRPPDKALAHEGRLILRTVRDHRDGGSPWQPSSDAPPPSRTPPPRQDTGPTLVQRLPRLLRELEQRMKEKYNFTVYAANERERSVNFGVMITYRQKWLPESYQAGELVKTLTLAPKQTQKLTVTRKTHQKRFQKEVENNVRNWREEVSQTSRAEEEIVRRAAIKTNFNLTTQHTFSVKVPVIGDTENTVTTAFGREASQSSDAIKKSFHEAVMKASAEYKNEHTTEVTTEASEDVETVESTEVTNPNDEIAVTFLFYELQRRFRVTEAIHKLMPVVLVAQEVPNPQDIDGDWLLTHDWILRRVMLDDSFIPALDLLTNDAAGEEIRVQQLKIAADEQYERVQGLRTQERDAQQRLTQLREYERLLNSRSIAEQLAVSHHSLYPRFGRDKDAVADAIREAEERTTNLRMSHDQEAAALTAAIAAYTKAFADASNRQTQVARLRVHVKQNILYYMQAIWSHEPPDQRFFRLHNTKIPVLKKARRKIRVDFDNVLDQDLVSMAHMRLPRFSPSPTHTYPAEIKPAVEPTFDTIPLSRAADLDTLLGFKGNYMIFGLKESNALTDIMMDPFVDRAFNTLIDPDDAGNGSLEDFANYICCLHKQLSPEEFASIRSQLQAQYRQLLSAARRADDMVTIPTGSLFIEALPATHSVVEEFKARHRAVDVKKVQAEVRRAELENIRYAARILDDELEDPEVEKRIIIEGDPGIVAPSDT